MTVDNRNRAAAAILKLHLLLLPTPPSRTCCFPVTSRSSTCGTFAPLGCVSTSPNSIRYNYINFTGQDSLSGSLLTRLPPAVMSFPFPSSPLLAYLVPWREGEKRMIGNGTPPTPIRSSGRRGLWEYTTPHWSVRVNGGRVKTGFSLFCFDDFGANWN